MNGEHLVCYTVDLQLIYLIYLTTWIVSLNFYKQLVSRYYLTLSMFTSPYASKYKFNGLEKIWPLRQMRYAFKGKSRNYFSCLYSFVYTLIGLKKIRRPSTVLCSGFVQFREFSQHLSQWRREKKSIPSILCSISQILART